LGTINKMDFWYLTISMISIKIMPNILALL
jgi:hypothetical protein